MFHYDSDNDISIGSIDIEHLKENQTKPNILYERYIEKGKEDLYDLYDMIKKHSDDFVKYITDKLAQRNEQILDKRCNCIAFNKLGYEYLDECFQSKDHS